MSNRTYRLRIVREGCEFEAEGDKSFVVGMLRQYGPIAVRGSEASGKGTRRDSGSKMPDQPTSIKSLSIREFVQQLDLKKHTDISLAFGYYLEKYQGVSEFTPADINNCYYEAKLESSNTSQMIAQNIKRGYLMASKRKGEKGRNRYMVTRSGEQFITTKLHAAS